MMEAVRPLCDVISHPGKAPGIRYKGFVVWESELEIIIVHNM